MNPSASVNCPHCRQELGWYVLCGVAQCPVTTLPKPLSVYMPGKVAAEPPVGPLDRDGNPPRRSDTGNLPSGTIRGLYVGAGVNARHR